MRRHLPLTISQPPTVRQVKETHISAAFASTLTSDSFTPANDSLLVLVITGIPNNNGPTPTPTVTTSGLTWTQRAAYQGSGLYGVYSQIWTAPVTTGAAMTVAVNLSEQQEIFSIAVYEVTNYDTASPIGASLATGGTTRSGAWSGALSATPDPSSVIISGVYSSNTPTITLNSSWTEGYRVTSGNSLMVAMSRTGLSNTTVEIDALATSFQWAASFLEIKGKSYPGIRPDAEDARGSWVTESPSKKLIETKYQASVSSLASASFTPTNGALLVVCASAVPLANGPTVVAVSGGGLTWTEQAFVQRTDDPYGAWSGVWTAQVATGASMTVTVDCAAETQESLTFSIFEVTGHDAVSPVGGVVETYQSDTQSGNFSGTLSSTPKTSSLLLGIVTANGSSANAVSVVDPNPTWVAETYQRVSAGTHYVTISKSKHGSTSIVVNHVASIFTRAMAIIEIKSATGLHSTIDEVSYNDADYISVETVDPVSGETCKVRLSDPSVTPAEPFIVRYRYRKLNPDGVMDFRFRLLQGVTEIASWTELNVSNEFRTMEHYLTSAQFAAITDFTDLYIEVRATYTP
jgi:hypothetical protein